MQDSYDINNDPFYTGSDARGSGASFEILEGVRGLHFGQGGRGGLNVGDGQIGQNLHLSTILEGRGAEARAELDSNIGKQEPTGQETWDTPGSGGDTILGNINSSTVLTIGAPAQTQYINTNGDQDWFQVTLVAGQYYEFVMDPDGSLDAVLEIRNEAGFLLGSADGPLGPETETVGFLCETSGTYFVVADGFTTSTGTYTIAANTAVAPPILNSINWGGNGNVVPGAADDIILVYFAQAGEVIDGNPPSLGWNAYEMQQTMLAFQQFSNVINVTFQVTTNINEADFKLVTNNSNEFLGFFGPPNTGSGSGVGVFARNGTGWDEAGGGGLEQGGYAFVTLTHEIGHGMGLAHPHDTGGGSSVMLGVTSAFGSFGVNQLNQNLFTVMSYNDAWDSGPNGATPTTGINDANFAWGYMGTLGALDIALLQDKYGANATFNSGDNIYEIAAANGLGVYYQTIWDTGGNDTIRYSGTLDAVINLNAATIDYSATGGGSPSYVTTATVNNRIYMAYTIAEGVVIERGTGGSGNDTITGNAVANTLNGRGGNDSLVGGLGGDILIGGAGADSLNGGTGDIDYASYIDSVAGVTVNLTTGVHLGDAAGDTFTNIERYRLSAFVDTFTGGAATDYAYGAEGGDTLNGAGGIDRLYGQADNDTLNGDAGNDILLGGAGADIHNGGADRDTASYEESSVAITINLTTLVHTGDATGDTWNSIEILWLSDFNDTFTGAGAADEVRGNDGVDTMNGMAGNDILRGENGNDILNGGDNDDFLNGGANADALDGGNGVDTAVYLLATAGVTINLTTNTHTGEAAGDTFTSIERFQLSNGFTLIDTFTGSAGNDWVAGYKGVDNLNGEGGDDTLNGGEHNDVLNGGAGLDKLIAGTGNDTLTGGTQSDQFHFNVGLFGNDIITDFENGVDFIRITGQAGIDNINDLVITQNGAHALITLPDGSTITVNNTLIASIDATDFLWI